jgi:hypothetical protein
VDGGRIMDGGRVVDGRKGGSILGGPATERPAG